MNDTTYSTTTYLHPVAVGLAADSWKHEEAVKGYELCSGEIRMVVEDAVLEVYRDSDEEPDYELITEDARDRVYGEWGRVW